MVIPRRWKVVSGGVTVAVALGAGAAIAKPDKQLPTLQDVAESTVTGVTTTTIAPDDDGVLSLELSAESPLSELSADSPESPESEESPESPESESPESPESEESPESPESPESDESPESPDSDD
jgi:hypothetical protein